MKLPRNVRNDGIYRLEQIVAMPSYRGNANDELGFRKRFVSWRYLQIFSFSAFLSIELAGDIRAAAFDVGDFFGAETLLVSIAG